MDFVAVSRSFPISLALPRRNFLVAAPCNGAEAQGSPWVDDDHFIGYDVGR